MSVVVWDGTWLAADRQANTADLAVTCQKLMRAENGNILAFTGTLECGLMLAQWYNEGANPDKWPEFQKTEEWTRLIVVDNEGASIYEKLPIAQKIHDTHASWGSGRDYALGAMAMGADAKRAVEIASEYNIDCGKGIDALRVDTCSPEELKVI